LRTGEAINVGSVLCDYDEIVEIALDEASLVFSPDWVSERPRLDHGTLNERITELE
jgi:hypothetical protein